MKRGFIIMGQESVWVEGGGRPLFEVAIVICSCRPIALLRAPGIVGLRVRGERVLAIDWMLNAATRCGREGP